MLFVNHLFVVFIPLLRSHISSRTRSNRVATTQTDVQGNGNVKYGYRNSLDGLRCEIAEAEGTLSIGGNTDKDAEEVDAVKEGAQSGH